MQCLNQVLHSERPDIEEKRNNLLKLQGEFAVRLRQLEKGDFNYNSAGIYYKISISIFYEISISIYSITFTALLNALNDSKGKILDDDSVIATLEKLKNEAKEVQKKSSETDEVIKEVVLEYNYV